MKLEDRIAKHRRMAEAYRDAYTSHDVHGGGQYAEWVYAADAIYSSPYFTGDQVFEFKDFPADTAQAATMEAKAYSLTFPDWKPASFNHWPADNGFVMKTRWQGTTGAKGLWPSAWPTARARPLSPRSSASSP